MAPNATTRLHARYRARRSYFRAREYFIIPGGIARAKRGVPKLDTVFFCPRRRLSGTTAPGDVPRDTLALAGATRCVTLLRRRFSSGTNVGVAAARGPPFFRDSLARPLSHPVRFFLPYTRCPGSTENYFHTFDACCSFLIRRTKFLGKWGSYENFCALNRGARFRYPLTLVKFDP